MSSRKRRRPRPASPLPAYRGRFGPAEAERLLWRAGFGPRPGEAEALARRGLGGAVRSLVRPGAERLVGPVPRTDDGPVSPGDAWGHEHLWWLDRMARTSRPLVERMTLNWHDWFATSTAEVKPTLMLRQNELLRRRGLGSFETLLLEITRDPAMLVWLSGNENTKWAPNENYAREMMELFTLGAGRGYTEKDVREQARALSGWRSEWKEGVGETNFRFDPKQHDDGVKRVFGKRGRFDWRDSVRLCVAHRKHPSFFVGKLWGYFIPVPPPTRDRRSLERLYVARGHAVRPVVEAILRHPLLYEGPRMVKPPAVYVAGLLRGSGRGVDTDAWTWIADLAGQRLFAPPNVAGWDETRWLDTATVRGRWIAANEAIGQARMLDPDPDKTPYDVNETPAQAVARALEFWGNPAVTDRTRARLEAFAGRAVGDKPWKRETYPILRQNALRMLVATSPDLQAA